MITYDRQAWRAITRAAKAVERGELTLEEFWKVVDLNPLYP